MNDDPLSDSDIVERLLAGDGNDDLSGLGDVLRDLRASATAQPVGPDDRLVAIFDRRDVVPSEDGRRRTWRRRPVVAFAAAFAGVLVFGAAALALVTRGSDPEPPPANIAATTTEATTISTGIVEIEGSEVLVTIPSAVGESIVDYVGCVLGEASDHLRQRLSDTTPSHGPRALVECGPIEITDLGPEAEEFRLELNTWLACNAEAFDAVFAAGFERSGHFLNQIEECGPPPSPGEFGVTFDLRGLEGIIGRLDLSEFDLELDGLLDGLLEDLAGGFPGRLPDGFELDKLESFFDSFDDGFPHLDKLFESLPPDVRDRIPSDLDLDRLNFSCFFSGEGTQLGELLEGFLQGLADDGDLDLDLSGLLSRLSNLEPDGTPFELCEVP